MPTPLLDLSAAPPSYDDSVEQAASPTTERAAAASGGNSSDGPGNEEKAGESVDPAGAGTGNPFSTAAQSTSKFFSSFGWGATKASEAGTTPPGGAAGVGGEDPPAAPAAPVETTAERLKKQAMENMLRDIAKQEADRRMAEHLKDMGKVKKERDNYKEQLRLIEEEFVKERKKMLALEEALERYIAKEEAAPAAATAPPPIQRSMTDESVTAAMLQSQANQHEEVLAAALAHAEEQGKTIFALRAELEEASAKLKASREEFDIVLRTSTAEKKALESKMGTIEAECAALKAAASSVPGAPTPPTPSTPPTPPTPPTPGLEEEVRELKAEKAAFVTALARLEGELMAKATAGASLAEQLKTQESAATTSTSRHEEILREALQAASDQAGLVKQAEASVAEGNLEIERLGAALTAARGDAQKMEQTTMELIEAAVAAERTSQETSRTEQMEDLKAAWEREKAEEFESTLSFWQTKWKNEKALAVEAAVAKGQEAWRVRSLSERNAAVELARMEVESRLSQAHSRAVAKLEQDHMAKTVSSAASLTAAQAEAGQLQGRVEELEGEVAASAERHGQQAAFYETRLADAERVARIEGDSLRKEVAEKEAKWRVLDRAKDDEFEEELRRLGGSLRAEGAKATEAAVVAAVAAAKKSFEDPADEKWQAVDSSHPAPPLTLDSPVIRHILDHWTDNMERLKFMQAWLQHILNGWPVHGKDGKFRQGLELAKLSPEVCDGFEKLIIPLLRRRTDIAVQAMARTQRTTWRDLRIKVTPAPRTGSGLGVGSPRPFGAGGRAGSGRSTSSSSSGGAGRGGGFGRSPAPRPTPQFVAPRKKAPKPPRR